MSINFTDKKKELFHIESHMIRPIIYQVFTRFLVALCICLLWDHFLNNGEIPLPLSNSFILATVFYAFMAWFAYLRSDGISAPKFDRQLFRFKKRQVHFYADMIDFVDEDPPTYDALDDDEKDRCLFLSNIITALLFIIASFVHP